MTERTSHEARESQTRPSHQRRLHLREVTAEASNYDGLGADLKAARVRNGFDLAEVADELRIRRVHIHAMEEGHFDDLPAPVYAVGFVRSYADYLGLDGEIAVEAFKQEASGLKGETKLVFPSPIPESRVPTGWLIAISLVLAGMIYAGWYYAEMNGRLATERVPPLPERLAALAPAPTVDGPASGEPVPVGPVETEETPAEGPITTDTVTGINPATTDVRVDLRQVGGLESEQQGVVERNSDGDPSSALSGIFEGSAPVSPSLSEDLSVPVGETPSAPNSDPLAVNESVATDDPVAADQPIATNEDGARVSRVIAVPPETSSEIASFGSMERTLRPPAESEPRNGADTTTSDTRAPPELATPPPQMGAETPPIETAPGPSQHEVPVDAVSDDPFRVNLETLSSVTAAMIKPETTPTASGDSGDSPAPITVEASEFSLPAGSEAPLADLASQPDIPDVVRVFRREDASPSAESSTEPSAITTAGTSGPEPVIEDETQVASASAALGLNLSERQPRVYGEGNWEARVVIKATTESWVQVLSRDGDLLLTRILRPGDQYLVPNRDDLFLMTGNAGGIEITVDGISVPPIGRPGVVRDNVALVPDRLIAGTAVNQ